MFNATTIIGVKHNGQLALAADGQVTLSNTIMKATANKLRKLSDGKVLTGFAGSAADGLTLLDMFEKKLQSYHGNILRAAVELAKDWRSDKVLRRLEALLIVANEEKLLILSGNGEVIEPDDDIAVIGSGGAYALAAAKALKKYSQLDAKGMALEALKIAASICIYTNDNINVETLGG